MVKSEESPKSKMAKTDEDGNPLSPVDLFIQCFSAAASAAMNSEASMPDPMADNKDGNFWNSSLGIFHIDSGLRRLCLELSEPFATYEKLVIVRARHIHERT